MGLLMRHTHASAQLALGHVHEIVHHYKAECEKKDARIRELEDKHHKVLAMYEELVSLKHEREIEAQRTQGAEKRKDMLFEKIELLLPIALSKFSPGGVGAPTQPALGEEMLRTFLKSLTPEQLRRLTSILRPDQAASIWEIYTKYAEREEQRDAAKKRTNGSANGANGSQS
jgi:hypothetical protein